MEISKEIGELQQQVDELFEKLEIASEREEEITAKYEVLFQELQE